MQLILSEDKTVCRLSGRKSSDELWIHLVLGGSKELWEKNRGDLRSLASHEPDERKSHWLLLALHGDSHRSLEICCLGGITRQQGRGVCVSWTSQKDIRWHLPAWGRQTSDQRRALSSLDNGKSGGYWSEQQLLGLLLVLSFLRASFEAFRQFFKGALSKFVKNFGLPQVNFKTLKS